MLPIVDKPLIQYAAEEAISAGIDTLIFVTGRNKRAIEDHFDANIELELALRTRGKDEQAELVRNILPTGVECIFVRQPEQLGLGHAVLCAERVVGREPFAVLLADDFLTDHDFGVTADLVSAFEASGNSQLSVLRVDGPDISKNGVVIPNASGNHISGLVEKPDPMSAPSNLASVGRYVFTPNIFNTLHSIVPDKSGEIQLADAINVQAKESAVQFVHLKGKRFDCGSIRGFMAASNYEFKSRFG